MTVMTPRNATDRCTVLERPRSVQVRHKDLWLDGYLTAQRRVPDGWLGACRLSDRARDAVSALAADQLRRTSPA